MKDLVSIITPVYNANKHLKECINSVINQTYQNWEHILVDDCSTDNSVSIIENFIVKDNRIQLLKQEHNSGAGFSRNKAIKEAKGRFIAFLDSDDYWHEEKLNKQIKFMITNNYSFTFTNYYVVYKQEKPPKYIVKAPEKVNYKKILKNDYIGCLTVIYDSKSTGKIYMPEIRKRQDWVLKINILRKVDYGYSIDEALAFYRIGEASLSKNKYKLLKHNFNVYYRELKMSFLRSVWMMIIFLIHYFHYKKTSKRLI